MVEQIRVTGEYSTVWRGICHERKDGGGEILT
jgi:hypothetical protein